MVFKSTGIDGITSRETVEREDVLEQVLGLHHLKVRDRRTCKEDEEIRGKKMQEDGITECKRGKYLKRKEW